MVSSDNSTNLAAVIANSEAIFFDLFHTLTAIEQTDPAIVSTADILGIDRDIWNRQLMENSSYRMIGIERDPFEIIQRMAREINPGISDEIIHKATRYRIDRFEKALMNISQETVAAIRSLKKRAKKIGLISNADVAEISGWDKSPLAPLFDSVIFSCNVGFAKPQKEIYALGLSALRTPSEKAIFVGDGNCRELEGAKAVGLTTVMMTGYVRDLKPEKIQERKKFADYSIAALRELVD